MGQCYELVLWHGKKAKMFVSQECHSDNEYFRVITTVSLWFPPDQFETPGWVHGVAVKHPNDAWDSDHAVRLAYKRAWHNLLTERQSSMTKEQWQVVRQARYEAMKPKPVVKKVEWTTTYRSTDLADALVHGLDAQLVKRWMEDLDRAFLTGRFPKEEEVKAWAADRLMEKYPYLASDPPVNGDKRGKSGASFAGRNVWVLLANGQERIGWLKDTGEWKILPAGYMPVGPADVGPRTSFGSEYVNPEEIARWGEIDDYSKLAEEVSRRTGAGSN